MANSDPASAGWHLDKRVPLALIITIIGQTAGAFWWASNISSRVTTLEGAISQMSLRGDRITRLEANQSHILQALNRIETLITAPKP